MSVSLASGWSVRLIAGSIVVLAGAAAWYFYNQPEVALNWRANEVEHDDSGAADPRLAFDTPYRNVKPDIEYVGDASCATCHGDIARSFHAHPMGQSADWVGRAQSIERYDAEARVHFSAEGFEFRVEKIGDRLVHRMSAADSKGVQLPDYVMSADIAIGSGTRGRSYVSFEKGALWQSPISWYSKAGRWDLSPMHSLDKGGRRPIIGECLFCHTNQASAVPNAINRFKDPPFAGQVQIGCERCHGPGQLHVAERLGAREVKGIDYSIVNPKHLSDSLKTDVCRQCHLQGLSRVARRGRDVFEYRPGLPWDQFATTFIMRPDLADYSKSVGQFEQMEISKCFKESGGKLGCVSCHDPHVKPKGNEAVRFYRDRCLTCHENKPCSEKQEVRQPKADSCIACHMPAKDSSNVAHVSITDHRIPKKPGAEPKQAVRLGGVPLVEYPPGPHAPSVAERERDWGIAASQSAQNVPQARGLWSLAEKRLAAAVAKWPGDDEAWRFLAGARSIGGDLPGALQAARAAIELNPNSEGGLELVAKLARDSGDLATALSAADKLVAMNSSAESHLLSRAELYLRMKNWAKVEADARAALAIQPLSGSARLYLAVCRHHRGFPEGAREDAATGAKLIPDQALRERYLQWFDLNTRK